MDKSNILEDEKLFPYENMSIEERNFCLELLKNCKDICDSNYPVDNCKTCNILEMHFKKEKRKIKANGSLIIGNNKQECRCAEVEFYIRENRVVVSMYITRLKVEDGVSKYRVIDDFKVKNKEIIRESTYDNTDGVFEDIVDNEIVKGRLR